MVGNSISYKVTCTVFGDVRACFYCVLSVFVRVYVFVRTDVHWQRSGVRQPVQAPEHLR